MPLGLKEVKYEVEKGEAPSRRVRELLRWFGAQRRGAVVVDHIEAQLKAAGLRTVPHFTTTWIDAHIVFKKLEADVPAPKAVPKSEHACFEPGSDDAESEEPADVPVPDSIDLISMLEAANRKVVSVKPEEPIEQAITLMLYHDYSQLAVMTNPRELKGAISWKSIGGRLSQRNELKFVGDAMENVVVLLDTNTIFEVTKSVIEREYVFVRAKRDRSITGIVTATDLSEQYHRLSEPFLLLGRIENQIRRLIDSVYGDDVLQEARAGRDSERKGEVTEASQLTFGDYVRIFERPENWDKLEFAASRETFREKMEGVRHLRNEIMHFHPDVIENGDFKQLRSFSRLLERLVKFGAKHS